MLFQSQEFVLLLLPITLALYYALADRPMARQAILVIASLVFYGWWDARFVPLLLGALRRRLGRAETRHKRTGRRVFIDVAIALQFISLATVQIHRLSSLPMSSRCWASPLPKSDILLPIGISFYTFQLVSLSDRRRARRGARPGRCRRYALFVSLLPASDRRADRAPQRADPAVRRDPLRPASASDLGHRPDRSSPSAWPRRCCWPTAWRLIADPVFDAAAHGDAASGCRRLDRARWPIRCRSISTSRPTPTWRSASR